MEDGELSRVKIPETDESLVLIRRRIYGEPQLVSAEKKILIVVSILRGEVTMAEASRREVVSQTSIAQWRDRFLAGGQAALSAGSHGTSSGEPQLPPVLLALP